MKWERWRRASGLVELVGSAVVLLALPFGVFYWANPLFTPKWPGLNTLGKDYADLSTQQQYELQFSLWHGTVPLYVPGFYGGQSASALTLGQFFHPLTYLASIMPQYWDTADPHGMNGHALQYNTLLRLLSLGITQWVLYRLIRSWGLGIVLSFVFSWVTVYNLRMLDMFRYGASLENFTAFLLLGAAILWTCDHPTRRAGPVWIVICTYLLVCGGHPQMMYYGLGGALLITLVAPHFLAAIREAPLGLRTALRHYRRVFAALIAGVLASSLYTFPFYFDFLWSSAGRVLQPYRWSCSFQARPLSALNGFLNPFYSDVHGAAGGAAIMVLGALVPLLLFVRPRVPRIMLLIWLLCAGLLVYAMGSAFPLHYLVWKYLPLANVFRAPGRALMVVIPLLLLLLVWLARCAPIEFSFRGRPRSLPAHVPLTVVGLVVYVLVNSLSPEALTQGLGVAEMQVGKGFFPAVIHAIPDWVQHLVFAAGLVSLGAMTLYGVWHRVQAVASIALVLAVVTQVTAVLAYGTWHGKGWPGSSWQNMVSMKRRSMNYQLGRGYGMGTQDVAKHLNYTTLETRLARLCTQYTPVASNDEAYDRLAGDWPRDDLLIEGLAESPGARLPTGEPVAEPGDVLLAYNSANKVVFDVDAACPAFFVLSFPFSSHWRAYVNGVPAHIYRVNGLEQAVCLPPGAQVVEFRYLSWAANLGMVLTCLTGSAVAWYALAGLRKRWLRAAGCVLAMLLFLALFVGWRYSLYHGQSLGTEYHWSADAGQTAAQVNQRDHCRVASTCGSGHCINVLRESP